MNTDWSEKRYVHDAQHEHLLNVRYANARDLMHAITAGDLARVLQALAAVSQSIAKANELFTPEEDSTLHIQYQLISLNTTFSICASSANVHPIYLHSLSRRFDKKIEHITNHEQESKLVIEMAQAYCETIKNTRTEHYGEFSDQIIQLLLASLSSPPCLKDLARQVGAAPSTVSRRFKAETGVTIPEFTNSTRIRLAKLYMQEGVLSMSQISAKLGFSDASYFSKVFIRYEAITPSQYIASIKHL